MRGKRARGVSSPDTHTDAHTHTHTRSHTHIHTRMCVLPRAAFSHSPQLRTVCASRRIQTHTRTHTQHTQPLTPASPTAAAYSYGRELIEHRLQEWQNSAAASAEARRNRRRHFRRSQTICRRAGVHLPRPRPSRMWTWGCCLLCLDCRCVCVAPCALLCICVGGESAPSA